ncbi:fimbrial protein [Salmonella enterica]|nr:fimbrial protein [Salmonella enterica]
MKAIITHHVLLFFLLAVTNISTVYADSVTVKINGEIFVPPCDINIGGSGKYRMEFGKIPLYQINNYNFYKTKTINITCKYYQGRPYIHLSGYTLSGANDNVIRTSGVNTNTLGIALYQGTGIDPNYPLRVGGGDQGDGYEIMKGLSHRNSEVSQFTFTAVPYKNRNSTLYAGVFMASVTMKISYL